MSLRGLANNDGIQTRGKTQKEKGAVNQSEVDLFADVLFIIAKNDQNDDATTVESPKVIKKQLEKDDDDENEKNKVHFKIDLDKISSQPVLSPKQQQQQKKKEPNVHLVINLEKIACIEQRQRPLQRILGEAEPPIPLSETSSSSSSSKEEEEEDEDEDEDKADDKDEIEEGKEEFIHELGEDKENAVKGQITSQTDNSEKKKKKPKPRFRFTPKKRKPDLRRREREEEMRNKRVAELKKAGSLDEYLMRHQGLQPVCDDDEKKKIILQRKRKFGEMSSNTASAASKPTSTGEPRSTRLRLEALRDDGRYHDCGIVDGPTKDANGRLVYAVRFSEDGTIVLDVPADKLFTKLGTRSTNDNATHSLVKSPRLNSM